MSDIRKRFEEVLARSNPEEGEATVALSYLASWHLERQSYQQARKYFGQLLVRQRSDPDVWISLCICCATAGETEESEQALIESVRLLEDPDADVRIIFCRGLCYVRL